MIGLGGSVPVLTAASIMGFAANNMFASADISDTGGANQFSGYYVDAQNVVHCRGRVNIANAAANKQIAIFPANLAPAAQQLAQGVAGAIGITAGGILYVTSAVAVTSLDGISWIPGA